MPFGGGAFGGAPYGGAGGASILLLLARLVIAKLGALYDEPCTDENGM